jgi:Xaa-Pro aminopeptidase
VTVRHTRNDQPMAAVLLFGDTEHSPALRHEVPLVILDSLMFCERDGRQFVLAKHLKRSRIERTLPHAEILEFSDFGMKELAESGLLPVEAEREVAVTVARHLGLREAMIPGDFPVALADRLREDGIRLRIDDRAVQRRRRTKVGPELNGIRAAQRAAEAGMTAAAQLLARAQPGDGGRLYLDGAELLTEHVREALRLACAAAGAPAPADVMITSVLSGFGNEPGSGPLPAGLPIQVDLWPRDEASGCWADMTRTFVVSEPKPEHAQLIAEQEELVRGALDHAIASVRPGVSGRALYDATCDRFEAAGYRTQRAGAGEDPGEGLQFSLGHGVGLEVHEPPILGLACTDALMAGDVLAIEPGLWDRRIGGVRFEDLVTDNGSEVLTHYPFALGPHGN